MAYVRTLTKTKIILAGKGAIVRFPGSIRSSWLSCKPLSVQRKYVALTRRRVEASTRTEQISSGTKRIIAYAMHQFHRHRVHYDHFSAACFVSIKKTNSNTKGTDVLQHRLIIHQTFPNPPSTAQMFHTCLPLPMWYTPYRRPVHLPEIRFQCKTTVYFWSAIVGQSLPRPRVP
jgi:hypothetical protein